MSSIRWKKFFIESGLPSDACENYAVIFSENRIGFDMLDELNKEILYDMGIKKLGDVIAILRHSKEVHSSSYREKVFATDHDRGVDSPIKSSVSSRNSSTPAMNSASSSSGPNTRSAIGGDRGGSGGRKFIKAADSTISNDRCSQIGPTSSSNDNDNGTAQRRIVVPRKNVSTSGAISNIAQAKSTNSISAPIATKVLRRPLPPTPAIEPVIIRNIGGFLMSPSSSSSSSSGSLKRRLIEGPDGCDQMNPDYPPLQERTLTIKMPQKYARLSSSSIDSRQPISIRNRIEAQSRLSNFSTVIQKAINANQASSSSTQNSIHQQRLSTATIDGNNNLNSSVKSRLRFGEQANSANSHTVTIRRDKPAPRDIKSRLGGGGASTSSVPQKKLTALDRLGNSKNVFNRLKSSNATSVFNRLGD